MRVMTRTSNAHQQREATMHKLWIIVIVLHSGRLAPAAPERRDDSYRVKL